MGEGSVTDRNGYPLAVGNYVELWYDDGSFGQAVVTDLDPDAEDGYPIGLSLDGGVEDYYRMADVEFVDVGDATV